PAVRRRVVAGPFAGDRHVPAAAAADPPVGSALAPLGGHLGVELLVDLGDLALQGLHGGLVGLDLVGQLGRRTGHLELVAAALGAVHGGRAVGRVAGDEHAPVVGDLLLPADGDLLADLLVEDLEEDRLGD